MRLIVIVLGLLTLLSFGCQDDPREAEVKMVDKSSRFQIESHGYFQAGGRDREILVITDTKTKQAYLGIVGIGVSEIVVVQSGKTTTTREE